MTIITAKLCGKLMLDSRIEETITMYRQNVRRQVSEDSMGL